MPKLTVLISGSVDIEVDDTYDTAAIEDPEIALEWMAEKLRDDASLVQEVIGGGVTLLDIWVHEWVDEETAD